MQMDWTAISTAIEFGALIFVILSIWYLARQLRLNTKAILSNSRQSLLDSDLALISDYMTYALDPHLVGDDVKLTPEDERRFTWVVIKAIRIREFAWHQYKEGNLDEATWNSYMAPVPGIFSTERAKAVLAFYTGSPEFMKVLNTQVDASKA